MKLSKKEKKLLKKKGRNTSVEQLAKELNVGEKDLVNYLKKNWREKKFEKIVEEKRNRKISLIRKDFVKQFSLTNFLRDNWVYLFVLLIVSLSVYFNSLNNNFLSDDIATIVESQNIGEASYFTTSNFPFFSLSDFLKFSSFKIFGLNPIGFRLINVFAHAGSSISVFVLISFFFAPPINFFAALIFATHPILSEAVVWISGQPYSVTTLLVFLSFIFYILHREKKKQKLLLISVLFYFAGFFGSEKMVTYPGLLILFELLQGDLFKSKTWSRLWPFCLIGGIKGITLIGLIPGRIESLKTDYYQTPGVENPLKQIPTAVGTYLELIFWPQRLVFYHSEETILTMKQFILKTTIFLPYFAALVYTFFKEKRLFFWLSFFFISLIPVLTPLKISWIVAERYVYFGAIGVFIPFAFVIYRLGERIKMKQISWILIIMVATGLSIRTYFRNRDFKDQDALWLASAKYAPNSPQNHNNLGDLYARRGEWDKAINAFQTAIKLKPNYADAYHNLGNTYRQANQQQKALESYEKAVQFNPSLWQSYQNIGALYYEQQQPQPAIEALEKAVQLNPNNDQLHANLGTVYLRIEQLELAKQEFQKAFNINPQNQRAIQGLQLVSPSNE